MRLSDLYPQLTKAERDALATRAHTDAGYLWQIATRWRGKRPSLNLIQRLAAADPRLSTSDLVDEFAGRPRDPRQV